MRIAINGFGRIGRTFLRCLLADHAKKNDIQLIVINVGSSEIQATAHMFKYDTLMGTFDKPVHMQGNSLIVDGYTIEIIAELDPQKLPWKKLSIDWVVDCTGAFTHREDALKHIAAKKIKAVPVAVSCHRTHVDMK